MSENGKDSENKYITKKYMCKVCDQMHEVKLNKNLVEGRKKYPFPYAFLHDSIKETNLKELLTILYIDEDFRIRGTQIEELGNDNLFSKEQVVSITENLMEEINILREENIRLKEVNKQLKRKS
ncbi:MAG: hypothetical protein BAJALOKI2v1_450005 [Promethearchaeota archaeon]|nr:MAG: hypothetical protein BAJALOKI2v1_450005 [Candidatus Lokiarchaeota archaeon]